MDYGSLSLKLFLIYIYNLLTGENLPSRKGLVLVGILVSLISSCIFGASSLGGHGTFSDTVLILWELLVEGEECHESD